nr:hypothetical protein [Angustibacter aerolatus]
MTLHQAPGALPAEALFARLRPAEVTGCFSTALVTAERWYGLPVTRHGTDDVLRRLSPYQNSNRVPLVLVDATVPPLDGSPSTPRSPQQPAGPARHRRPRHAAGRLRAPAPHRRPAPHRAPRRPRVRVPQAAHGTRPARCRPAVPPRPAASPPRPAHCPPAPHDLTRGRPAARAEARSWVPTGPTGGLLPARSASRVPRARHRPSTLPGLRE